MSASQAKAPEVHVRPYWELTFDADGDPNVRQLAKVLREAPRVHDLVVFAHGWNNDHSIATRLYDRFFAPFPALAADATVGYVGVFWPSMRFTDEPIPDFDPAAARAAAAKAPRTTLDKGTRHALAEVFPRGAPVVDLIARRLEEQPDAASAFDEFGGLVRQLVGVSPSAATADLTEDGGQHSTPAMLHEDTRSVCLEFASALETAAGPGAAASLRLPGGLEKAWRGAHELLRQATYFAMKRRAGKVGQTGLGPALGRIAEEAPGVRVHLVGHSFGARLVSFALAGLPKAARNVKSVTLLQGAFSHYAFAPRGALNGRQARVDGPMVACFSRYDTALSVMYPLASRLAGDDRELRDLGERWGALGHDGFKEVAGAVRFTLADVLRAGVPGAGCVSVDAAQVVRDGPPPSGAHSDICHEELARVVLGAGRITG
ncbi:MULTISPECIES: serine-threonine protein kinase [unclassified Streptomyces]|uniref:serine-threonine protein kinase n=1 Tax=unclassified Streptomyces TaxID=2593676 RepID=UPI00278BEA12|nr:MULTISPECIES: serine-threonine protein kinase [unclassified Streptomyces]